MCHLIATGSVFAAISVGSLHHLVYSLKIAEGRAAADFSAGMVSNQE